MTDALALNQRSCLCLRVGQQDVDIKLSGHFIKEIHCVFVSETNEQGEGETPRLQLPRC